ncbi:flagellin [Algimonas porphyrae]|uniref:Flagellin n=1 Tax=Algimonas porphyrae TaxID=1128113 RepID=A0ABQ5V1L9_9PROT|nr:flagellin [Algimonas porphyrae]GLQ21446.1 flagellin [Algimonas porphyrae]
MRFALTPDSLFTVRQSRQNAELRARLETVSQEVITGRRADTLEATNGRLGDAFLLDKASADITRQRSMADLAGARLNGAAGSVSVIRETLLGFNGTARNSLAQGHENDLDLLTLNASDALAQITGALSRRQGTRHLFSGTQSVGVPLSSPADIEAGVNAIISGSADAATASADIEAYFNAPGGGFETDIYQGSAEDGPRLHITDTKSFDPLPKGDDPLFRDILRGLSLVAGSGNATTRDDQIAMIEEGLALLDTAVEGVLAMESRLGSAQQSLERTDSVLQTEASLIAAAQDKLLGRDVFDAAAELQSLEGQLEASYTVTGRLGSLSLANFLR